MSSVHRIASALFSKFCLGIFVPLLTTQLLVAQSGTTKEQSPSASGAPRAVSPGSGKSPYRATSSRHATNFYQAIWGVDSFSAKIVESGEMVRFSYRILDAQKAEPLNDKKNEPAMLDERAHVKLVIPTLEKVGQLRQSGTPQEGKVYWMVFANKERYVKRGDRVSVVIGKFRVDSILVE
jgi:hypothetical protein